MADARSLLFVPGIDQHKISKSRSLAADVIILDLEDGVVPSRKADARSTVAGSLAQGGWTVPVWVRVNQPGSEACAADLAVLRDTPPAAIVVPKVDGPSDMTWVRERCPPGVELIATLETASGVLMAPDIATCDEGVHALFFGAVDFVRDIGADWDPQARWLDHPRMLVVMAACAAQLQAYDSPSVLELSDLDAVARDAARAKAMGFDGKVLVHPSHIAVVNDVFAPTEKDIARARRIIDAFTAASREGVGVIRVDDELISRPAVDRARRIMGQTHQRGSSDSA